jgi:hypothetical protein
MSSKQLIEKIASSFGEVPAQAEVIGLRQYSLDEVEQRARRFLSTTGAVCNLALDHGDWVVGEGQTVIRLPRGASAVIYHASGAMQLDLGLAPMESLFKKVEERERLVRQVEKTAERLNLYEWAGQKQALQFERLWQIKATAADPNGKSVEPVLCRIVGAYRHFVNELPVWGAASVALKLAGDGALDSLTIQLREPTGEVLDRAEILPPERAAYQIALQLEGLMGRSEVNLDEVAVPEWSYFGYLSLSKNKAQRLLAPVYITGIKIVGESTSQGYILTTPATEKAYLPLNLNGSEAHVTLSRERLRVPC